jgi:hypothetical protein
MLPKMQPALAPEVSTVTSLVQKVDEAVAAAGNPADAWQLYRRIAGFYSHYGSFPEACSTANTPRQGTSSMAGTPRAHAGDSASGALNG